MRDIWGKFRAALCISGGNSRPPPTLSPPDLATGGDEGGVGEGGEDLLSALPDDVLLRILDRLPSAAAAAQTSVLSRRWRRLWEHLPMLRFPLPAEPDHALPSPAATRASVLSRRWRRLWAHLPALRFSLPAEPGHALPSPSSARAALERHAAPALWYLWIVANDADPVDTAAVLRLAAPRLTGRLIFQNVVPEDRKKLEVAEARGRDAIELPCFDKAEWILLRLGYLRLALPPSGVFPKLTLLRLEHVRFQGDCDIGNAFSSARCPSLRQLCLFNVQGVSSLTICSESLISMYLVCLKGLQQLTLVAPMLREMSIFKCFMRQPVADISAPVLKIFRWVEKYDPSTVHLGELAQLWVLEAPFCFGRYGWNALPLLQHFRKIPVLYLLVYPPNMINCQYLVEHITLLPVPDIKDLSLRLVKHGHAIGICVFWFLKICTSIRRLNLHIFEGIKEPDNCSPDCVCNQPPQDWETEELILNSLQNLHIVGLRGADHDFTFVKQLLGWKSALKTIDISFSPSANIDEELCKELHGLARPETCMKIYLYHNGAWVKYTPVG